MTMPAWMKDSTLESNSGNGHAQPSSGQYDDASNRTPRTEHRNSSRSKSPSRRNRDRSRFSYAMK